eukprot:7871883-Alexandrium_andersonii.AAC.1
MAVRHACSGAAGSSSAAPPPHSQSFMLKEHASHTSAPILCDLLQGAHHRCSQPLSPLFGLAEK